MSAAGSRWARLSSRTVFRGRVFEVVRDEVRIDAGDDARETRFDVVRHPGAAAIVPLFEDGATVLVHQYRYAVGERIWEIPAGSLAGGESFESCAARELEEEIGWRAGRLTRLAAFYTTPGFSDERMEVFLAEELTPATLRHDPDEDIELERVPLETALDWAAGGRIADAKSLLGLSAASRHLAARGR